MKYHQITTEERYTISVLKKQGVSYSAIARELGRSPSTISREIKRNIADYSYRAHVADMKASNRRKTTRRKWRYRDVELQMVVALIRLDWSPEQVSNWLKKQKILSISHETIYRYIWYDKYYGGKLYKHLRHSSKQRRKRYGHYDSRGMLTKKRHITERPLSADNKSRTGHWEIDTVMGARDKHCIVTMVERKTKFTHIIKLENRSVSELNHKVIHYLNTVKQPVKTITADNGTEFHGFEEIEKKTGAQFYFATPYHSWERGLNENTNGLIRQYLPKRKSMKSITQSDCNAIASKLNRRPRKCLGYLTPEQKFEQYL